MLEESGVYIHIPFCKRKCRYCDFVSYQGREDMIDGYVQCLKKEAALLAGLYGGIGFKTVYIGGGTPSYINPEYLVDVLDECRRRYNLEEAGEISIETNPGTLDKEKLKAYKSAGINRISMGLQACQDNLLRNLGRIHSYDEFLKGYDMAREAGFDNINIDLIFGLPGQNLKEWNETLENIIKLKPAHVSCYSLKIEENTPFFEIYGPNTDAGICELPSEDDERQMYHQAVSVLKSAGYQHYEISNFCLPGYECRHNLIYWKCRPYIGIGAGAHSYFGGERYSNERRLDGYMRSIEEGVLPVVERETIGSEQRTSEFMILGLRLVEGVRKEEFTKRFGVDIYDCYAVEINRFIELGMLVDDGEFISLTNRSLDLANQVMMEFL